MPITSALSAAASSCRFVCVALSWQSSRQSSQQSTSDPIQRSSEQPATGSDSPSIYIISCAPPSVFSFDFISDTSVALLQLLLAILACVNLLPVPNHVALSSWSALCGSSSILHGSCFHILVPMFCVLLKVPCQGHARTVIGINLVPLLCPLSCFLRLKFLFVRIVRIGPVYCPLLFATIRCNIFPNRELLFAG